MSESTGYDAIPIETELMMQVNRLYAKESVNPLSYFEKMLIKTILNELRTSPARSFNELVEEVNNIYNNTDFGNSNRYLAESCIPQSLLGVDVNQFPAITNNQKEFIISVIKYMDKAIIGQCFMMIGGVGTGKSFQAAAILQNAVKSRSGLWIDNSDFAERVRLNKKPLAGLMQYSYIVIDDFLSKCSEATIHQYFNWINKLVENRINIITTSNWEISKANDDQIDIKAIYSRLSQKPNIICRLGWGDLRKE